LPASRKSNLGPLRPATGFRIEFDAGRTTFTRQAGADMGADVKLLKAAEGTDFRGHRDTAILMTFYDPGWRLSEVAGMRRLTAWPP
jgi:hypothetical protein